MCRDKIKIELTDIVSAIVVQITSLCMTFLVHTPPCVFRQRSRRHKNDSVMYLRRGAMYVQFNDIIYV